MVYCHPEPFSTEWMFYFFYHNCTIYCFNMPMVAGKNANKCLFKLILSKFHYASFSSIAIPSLQSISMHETCNFTGDSVQTTICRIIPYKNQPNAEFCHTFIQKSSNYRIFPYFHTKISQIPHFATFSYENSYKNSNKPVQFNDVFENWRSLSHLQSCHLTHSSSHSLSTHSIGFMQCCESL